MVIPSPPSSSTRPPSSFPGKLRRQSFERPLPSLPQPSLARTGSRSHSTPPQHTLAASTSSSFGESIFQSLSFGPFAPDAGRPTLADVQESPTDPGSETPRPPSRQKFDPARRRVTSPDTSHPLRADNTHNAETYTAGAIRPAHSAPRSPPSAFCDQPRKTRSALRLTRLRPGSAKGEISQMDAASTSASLWRPSSARGSATGDRVSQRVTTARRPGSAGEVVRRGTTHGIGEMERENFVRPASSSGLNGKGRAMRVRASSELTRPSVPLSAVLREADEYPPRANDHRDPRPPMSLASAAASALAAAPTLAPASVSPVVQSAISAESALADDSDVDADAPTTPSLTTGASRAGSRSNSSVKDAPASDPRSRALSSTPKPLPVSDADTLHRTRARVDADRRRRGETAREQEEKKQRAKYFKLKGPSKERCHAFSVKEAPYPVSYSSKVLDHYNMEIDLALQTILSVTFHKFEVPPAKVLDLGCGTGYWILKAAREWTETEFVGFDLVPIQPNLERVTGRSGVSANGTSHVDLRLQERIRWVHGNFLEKLPFEDGEFDLVRCRKIARGVPESSWDSLYEEIVRVMKPGAALEHIEEDIIFPCEISNKPSPPVVAVYPTPSPSRTLPTPPYLSSTSLPHASATRPPDQYRRSPSTSFSSVLESPVEGKNQVPSISSMSSASLVGPHEPLTSRYNTSPIPMSSHRTTLVVPGSATASFHPDVASIPRDSRGSGDSSDRAPKLGQVTDYSFYDPRAHTRLEELFVSMHDARWINLKPLSLLPRLIQEHMTRVVSSPPLNMSLPARPRDSPQPSRMVGVYDISRATDDNLAKKIAEFCATQSGIEIDPSMFVPQPGDEEVGRFLNFDFVRMGAVSKHGPVGVMPVGTFQFDLGWLPLHFSSATTEVLACKEAMWEHLKQQEPGFDRREFDAMIRQYQTDAQDRVGLSSALRQKLNWGPPESDFMRTADQRVFEEHYTQAIARERADPASANRPPRLMRCVRAFVAWKPTE
ncbi:UbiE/COQ5 family methyltransferase [Ceratobasidium theobromae]|uniref:UbiE/COQ5 family methyltransferase n=1 Tax=Ceratobasidium theobromae TaxID=1582974 RepID=A0A5N5QQ41_9AGAM|nr:UbiE/COQ5 family methyltransferase [Ceratobasidium theobromae]